MYCGWGNEKSRRSGCEACLELEFSRKIGKATWAGVVCITNLTVESEGAR